MTTTSQAQGGLGYDAAGDITNDGVNQYLYDGEGRICAVLGQPPISGGPPSMTGYIYNAEGQRVAKGIITSWSCDAATNGFMAQNDYVVGLSGEQLTEMGVGENGNMAWNHTNVYANGQLMATYDNDGLHFHLSDALGTRRAQTDYAGVLEQTFSSLPFGDFLTGDGQGNDATEHHYTGKERDSESNLDYFGARYYASTMGRFMSPDWSVKQEPVPYSKLDNPQTLNLYSYVQNNPLSQRDFDGHASGGSCAADGSGARCWAADYNGEYNIGNDQLAQQQNTITANAKGGSVTYTYPDGSKIVLTGDHPFRDNNPGDLRSGHGSIGRDGGFAIYPTLDAGVNALGATLTGKYADSTIGDTMKAFAPASDGNDPVKYANTLATAVGVPVTTKISALTPAS